MPGMMRGRDCQTRSLKQSRQRRPGRFMRPAVYLISRGHSERERYQEEIPQNAGYGFRFCRCEPPYRHIDGKRDDAIVAVQLQETVACHRERIAMMLAKRGDKLPADNRCGFLQKCIEKPVHDAGHEVGEGDSG